MGWGRGTATVGLWGGRRAAAVPQSIDKIGFEASLSASFVVGVRVGTGWDGGRVVRLLCWPRIERMERQNRDEDECVRAWVGVGVGVGVHKKGRERRK